MLKDFTSAERVFLAMVTFGIRRLDLEKPKRRHSNDDKDAQESFRIERFIPATIIGVKIVGFSVS